MGLDKSWKKFRKKVKKALRITKNDVKKTFKKIAPIVSIVNPIAGIAMSTIAEGKEGFKSALTSALVSNVLMGKDIFNLSASGRFPEARKLITKTIKNPQKILTNTLTSGGDLKEGLLKTVMQMSGNVPKELQAAITGDFGGVFLSDLLQGGGGFNLKDPLVLAMLYEAYKTEPPKPPTLPELKMIPDEEVFKRLEMFKEDLDEATQERINMAKTQFASRGIRGSMLDKEIRLIHKDRDFQMRKAEMEIRDQQLRYNNAVAKEQYAMQVNNYQLQAQAQKEKMEALTNTIALLQTKSNVLSEDILTNFKTTVTDMGKQLGLVKDVGDKQFFVDENTGVSLDISSTIFGNPNYPEDIKKQYVEFEKYKPQIGFNLDTKFEVNEELLNFGGN